MSAPAVTIVELDALVDLDALLAFGWATALDECLAAWATLRGHHYRPFDDEDLRLVVGRDDLDAAAALLEARRIVLPIGDATDDEAAFTLHGLARRRRAVVGTLAAGAVLHPDAESWLAARRPAAVVVVSAMHDADAVARGAGIDRRVAAVIAPPRPEVVVVEPPHLVLLRQAMDAVGASPRTTEVISSTEPLVTAARQLGIVRVVGLARRRGRDLVSPGGVDEVVSTLAPIAARPVPSSQS